MKLYIDTEFNGFEGELISMALVSEDGKEYYENLGCESPVPWVEDNVMPILNKPPVSKAIAQGILQNFLIQWDEVCIVADWPEDIAHFCQFLIVGPGSMMNTPKLTFDIQKVSAGSELPHNALSDAHGIRDYFNSPTRHLDTERDL